MSDRSLWDRVSLPTETLIGGIYAGGLLAFLAAYCNPLLTQSTISVLGSVVGPIALVVVGVGVFVLYRVILGEWFLYPIRHRIHNMFDKRHRRLYPTDFQSFVALLENEGVAPGMARFAYSEIRDSDGVLEQATRERLDLIHAAYHFFYVTAMEAGVAVCYLNGHPEFGRNWKPLAYLAALLLIAAFFADIRQDRRECMLIGRDRVRLRAFLEGHGYLKQNLQNNEMLSPK